MSGAAEQVAVLRGRVVEEERALAEALDELAVATRRSVDPSHWIREKPVLWMTGAVAVGWWVGSRTGRARRVSS